jgi:hypothetical protein
MLPTPSIAPALSDPRWADAPVHGFVPPGGRSSRERAH